MSDWMELTVAGAHEAMREGRLTCLELVQFYLERILTLDKTGPAVNAVIAVNPRASREAESLDLFLELNGRLSGPLHGIPVLLKDNVDTRGLETTAGSKSLEGFIPQDDAFLVDKLKEAGAVILAKTNLHEFAIWGETVSSLGGQTLNPYDLTRTPGGSSGGTGAAVACNFGLLGIGTDTINSIRSPASACGLVGIRPTVGLVSRTGIVPYSLTQDTAGPMCRTVEDCVRTLDVIAAYDPKDPQTAWGVGRRPESYLTSLKREGLSGKRLGVVKSLFGQKEVNRPVNQVMEEALDLLEAGGAVLVPIEEDLDADRILETLSVHLDDFRAHLDAYLGALPPEAPVHSVRGIIDSGRYHPGIEENLKTAMSLEIGTPAYQRKLIGQAELRTRLMQLMAFHRLDALVYPHQRQLVCRVGESQKERNGVLCSATGFPSIAVPAGFAPSPDAPLGVPVGMEIAGRPFSEPVLIEIAYAFEELAQKRRPPKACDL